MTLPKISLYCILKVWFVLNFLFGFSVGSCSAFVALDWAIFSFTCVCSSESTVLCLIAAFLFLNDSNLFYCCFKDIFFFYSSKNSLKFQVYWSTSINWVLRIDWYFSLFPPKRNHLIPSTIVFFFSSDTSSKLYIHVLLIHHVLLILNFAPTIPYTSIHLLQFWSSKGAIGTILVLDFDYANLR